MKNARPERKNLDHKNILFNDIGPVHTPSDKEIQKLLGAITPTREGIDPIYVLKNISIWNYAMAGIEKRSLGKEHKRKFKKLKDQALSLMNEIETCLLDDNLGDLYFLDEKLEQNKAIVSSYDAAQVLADECQNFIRNKSKVDIFPHFVFEVAVLFEYLSKDKFTSTNADPRLITKGEKFAEIVCAVLDEMIYQEETSQAEAYYAHYGEYPDNEKPVRKKTPSHRIKTACSSARGKIQNYGENQTKD